MVSVEFDALIEDLYFDLCESGITEVGIPDSSTQKLLDFQIAVHRGWKRAQLKIYEALKQVTFEISECEKDWKATRSGGNKDVRNALAKKRKLLQYQKNAFIAAQNAIVWSVFGQQTWIVRRFFLDTEIDNFALREVDRAFKYINDVNTSERALAVSCDMTSFMHVGDVVQVELMPNGSRSVTIVELKEGLQNQKLSELLDDLSERQCPQATAYQLSMLNEKDRQQANRMIRQQWRLTNSTDAVNTGRAKDISRGWDVRIADKQYVLDSYDEVILNLYEKIRSGKSWAIDVVEDCLFVGLYRGAPMTAAFRMWLKGLGFNGMKFDYARDANFPLARPVFTHSWPKELVLHLLKRECFLLLGLDVPKWIEAANARWPRFLKLETRKRSQKAKIKNGDSIEFYHRLILAKVGDREFHVGTGILAKTIFEFYNPVDVFAPWHDSLADDI